MEQMLNSGKTSVILLCLIFLILFSANKQSGFAQSLNYTPTETEYYDLINGVYEFTDEELAYLEQNGFVLTDRLSYNNFMYAYAYIYWKDLPVLVTTDSMLHAIHQTYDDMLIRLETLVFAPWLELILDDMLTEVQQQRADNTDPELDPLYEEIELYIGVPDAILSSALKENAQSAHPYISHEYLGLIQSADSIVDVDLFGVSRQVDFTQFQLRGHYTQSSYLTAYFRAMTWLQLIDFPLVTYDPSGNPDVQMQSIASATLLRNIIESSGVRDDLENFDKVLMDLVGVSDNIRLDGLDTFLADANLNTPTDVLQLQSTSELAQLLEDNDYGTQQIKGQQGFADAGSSTPQRLPQVFALSGKRFVIDTAIMSDLTFDSLIVDGNKVQRPYPNPLDVLYVLGNDRAATHLQDEFEQYGYESVAQAMQDDVAAIDGDGWNDSFYNRWLTILMSLNTPPESQYMPVTMQTDTWQDKILHTQLASWAQLRHDNILYAEQSYTMQPLCEYPAGYVEPYPEFYDAIVRYADYGRGFIQHLDIESLPHDPDAYFSIRESARELVTQIDQYFYDLEYAALRLRTMAGKELQLEPFNNDEELFLRSIVVREVELEQGCSISFNETWDGWYVKILPWLDSDPALVADIHTNLNTDASYPDLLPPGVLHVATGDVSTAFVIVETPESNTLYVGPTFTYYQWIEEGYPPHRVTDGDWRQQLDKNNLPSILDWISAFRITSDTAIIPLQPGSVVEDEYYDKYIDVIPGEIHQMGFITDDWGRGTLSVGGKDIWQLEGLAGTTLSISLNGEWDTILSIYDSSGNLIAENDDAPNRTDYNSKITNLTLPSDDTYTVEVTGYDDVQGGFYWLTIENLDNE